MGITHSKEVIKGDIQMNSDPLLNEIETAERLNISTPLLRKWRYQQTELPFVKMGKSVRYKASDVESFISLKTVEPIEQITY